MTSNKLDILTWIYHQIAKDEELYPFASRSWEYKHNDDWVAVYRKRIWRGKDAWWRSAFHMSKSPLLPWTRRKSETPGLFSMDEVFYPSKYKIYPVQTFYLWVAAWRSHKDKPDALVDGNLVFWGETADYIKEWDPERTDRECEAKRKVLQFHRKIVDILGIESCAQDYEEWPCATVRSIADVYSHREGYGQWTPKSGS